MQPRFLRKSCKAVNPLLLAIVFIGGVFLQGSIITSIRIANNAIGIPQKIKEKIFNPFFTTKPTGQGTGLGLSLSYDIVKTHGGDIKVESEEGEGTVLIIQLPI